MRFRVCFLCKEYQPIHPGNSLSNLLIEDFSAKHYKHPLQTIAKDEIPKDFVRYIIGMVTKNESQD